MTTEGATPGNQLVIATDGPFRVFCNTCGRWVDGDRCNIDGTHDIQDATTGLDSSARTSHTVWEPKGT